MINVLVVEALTAERELLVRTLDSDAQIKVVGVALDGFEAVAAARRFRPDAIVMALRLPKMNGLETTRCIMETDPCPIVLVRARHVSDAASVTLDAMGAGALAVLPSLVERDHRVYEDAARTLVQTVKLMSEIRVVRRWSRCQQAPPVIRRLTRPPLAAPEKLRVVAIGASTGGPPALRALLAGLPRTFPIPLLIVQHMAVGFIQGFVDWLGLCTSLTVQVAKQGDPLLAGHVYVAPDGYQMMINKMNQIVLTSDDHENGLRPSVSYLFRSVTELYGSGVIAILLSGMGRDGAAELAALKERGAITLAQDKMSSVVHGMPGAAIKLDAALYILPPNEMAEVLVKLVNLGGNNVQGVMA